MMPAETPSQGVAAIALERFRQLTTLGFTPAHDDQHTGGELVHAAIAYALTATGSRTEPVKWWPWDDDEAEFTPDAADPVHDLRRAGALIAAEIDRQLRARQPAGDPLIRTRERNP